ncbi:MAG TPA: PQQ-binding-like beta-propeller repeat protein, partial [Acidimicrobiales bacterium]|nr:PQQ-binding-like beta-propeller repeat protein [Acidimicrobiales bacterium]
DSDMSVDPTISSANASTLGVRWMTNTGQQVLSSPISQYVPAVSKTLIFSGNEAGYFTAFDQATGLPVWSDQLSNSLRSSAVSDGTSVWVTDTVDNRLMKMDAATGSVECSVPVGDTPGETVDASPVLATPPGGVQTVYVGSNDVGTFNGPLTAVQASDCSVEFKSTPEPTPGSGGLWDFINYSVDATGEPLILFGTADPDSAVYAIDALTGALVWRYAPFNPPPGTYDVGAGVTTTAPGVNGFADGVAYVPTKFGIVYALDLTTGALIWQLNFAAITKATPGGSLSTPAISGTNLVLDADGGTLDINAKTGAELWFTSSNNTGVDAAPAIEGPVGQKTVAVMLTQGTLEVLSLATGAILYSYQTGNFAVSSAIDTNGNLIDTSGDGFMYDWSLGGGNGGAPAGSVTSPKAGATIGNPKTGLLTFSGTATDSIGVGSVGVAVQLNGTSGLWWNGSTSAWGVEPYPNPATVTGAGSTSATWKVQVPVPLAGGTLTAFVSTVGTNGVTDVAAESSAPGGARSTVTIAPMAGAPAVKPATPWVQPGTSLAVTGSGFAPNESVAFSLEGTSLNNLTADGTGAVAGTLSVPTGLAYGPQVLTATGTTSSKTTTAPLYVSSTWTQAGDTSALDAFDANDNVLSHHLSVSSPTFLQQAWTFSTGAAIDGSVLLKDQVAYVADTAGTIDAINVSTATQRWSASTPDGSAIDNTPALTPAGNIVVATASGTVFAISQATGALKWTESIGGDFAASPTVAGTTAYVADTTGTVTALKTTTGAPIWSAHLGSAPAAGMAVDPTAGLVVLGDAAGNVVALGTSSGATKWTVPTTAAITAPPMILNGVVYAGSTDDTVYALAETTGAGKWTYNTGSPITTPLAAESGQVVVGLPTGHIIYLKAGALAYDVNLKSPITGVGSADNFVASETASGNVYGSKPAATDPKAWSAVTSTTFTGAPTVVNGEVFMAGHDGTVRCYTVPGSVPV